MKNLLRKAGGIIIFFIVIISFKFASLILQIDFTDAGKVGVLCVACASVISYYLITYLDGN